MEVDGTVHIARVVPVPPTISPEARAFLSRPFPGEAAALDDSVAVYRELLKTYSLDHIAFYGTFAGAILTAQAAVRLKQLKMPQPAALGIFSVIGDYSQSSDTHAMYLCYAVDARLIVFEALPHAFWNDFHLAELREGYSYMADFLGGRVNVSPKLAKFGRVATSL